MEDTEKQIKAILIRNEKVEADKAWEISWTRRLFLAALTYLCAWAWLLIIKQPFAWLTAVVPVLGYILSTLTLPPLKNWWLKRKV